MRLPEKPKGARLRTNHTESSHEVKGQSHAAEDVLYQYLHPLVQRTDPDGSAASNIHRKPNERRCIQGLLQFRQTALTVPLFFSSCHLLYGCTNTPFYCFEEERLYLQLFSSLSLTKRNVLFFFFNRDAHAI